MTQLYIRWQLSSRVSQDSHHCSLQVTTTVSPHHLAHRMSNHDANMTPTLENSLTCVGLSIGLNVALFGVTVNNDATFRFSASQFSTAKLQR